MLVRNPLIDILPQSIKSDIQIIENSAVVLSDDEMKSINGTASPRRVSEFFYGRSCAKRAIKEFLSIEADLKIPSSKTGQPVWPSGYVGSISHKSHFAVAVVGLSTMHRSIGVDLEIAREHDLEMISQICTEYEIKKIKEHDEKEWHKLVSLYFSIKEAFFKFQFPFLFLNLDFLDVIVDIDINEKKFQIKAVNNQKIENLLQDEVFTGFFVYEKSLLISVCYTTYKLS